MTLLIQIILVHHLMHANFLDMSIAKAAALIRHPAPNIAVQMNNVKTIRFVVKTRPAGTENANQHHCAHITNALPMNIARNTDARRSIHALVTNVKAGAGILRTTRSTAGIAIQIVHELKRVLVFAKMGSVNSKMLLAIHRVKRIKPAGTENVFAPSRIMYFAMTLASIPWNRMSIVVQMNTAKTMRHAPLMKHANMAYARSSSVQNRIKSIYIWEPVSLMM